MTIEQIYNQQQATSAPTSVKNRFTPDSADLLSGYTLDVSNEFSVQFPRLPNPIIVLYIFPHLSVEGTPVPGYSTTFPMYERLEYALPGEVFSQ